MSRVYSRQAPRVSLKEMLKKVAESAAKGILVPVGAATRTEIPAPKFDPNQATSCVPPAPTPVTVTGTGDEDEDAVAVATE
jgi:hypothetical protein